MNDRWEVYGYVRGVGYVRHIIGAVSSTAAASAVAAMYGGRFDLGYVKAVD